VRWNPLISVLCETVGSQNGNSGQMLRVSPSDPDLASLSEREEDMEELRALGPPPRYASTEELEKIFIGAIPALATQLLSPFGKRTPRITRKEKARLHRKLRRLLAVTRPYLLALGALKGQLDAKQCEYALLEGLLREQYKAGGVRIPERQDAFEFQLKLATKAARPNRYLERLPPYSDARGLVEKFAAHLVQTLPWPTLDQSLNDWARSMEATKFLHFIGQWPTLTRQFRTEQPRRLTQKVARDLAEEYRLSSALFEQCLRLLVHLLSAAPSKPASWSTVTAKSLYQLLQQAERNDQLKSFAALIDRHVRNSLAHGVPQLFPDSRQVRFDARGEGVTWTLQEFFDNTRGLTLAACAMEEFFPILQLQLTRCLLMSLWRPSA